MKKLFIPVLLIGFFLSPRVNAQMDYKIATGVISYDQQDYEAALTVLNQALADLAQLKEKSVPKGFYYRALCWQGALAKAAQEQNAQKIEKYKDALLNSYEDLKMATKYDDGKWASKIQDAKTRMAGQILGAGAMILDEGFSDKATPEESKQILTESLKYFEAAKEMKPDNFTVYNFLGQAYLALNDTASALGAFTTGSEKFKAKLPEQPELEIGFIYYNLGLLLRYNKHDFNGALAALNEGKTLLTSEYKRVEEKKASFNAEYLKAAESRFATLKDALNKAELNILRENPSMRDQAMAKFEKAITEEPKNYFLYVAYAQLMENIDKNKSKELYKKAIEIGPNEFVGYLNLGAIYVNEAIEIYKEANAMTDYEKGEVHAKKGDALFNEAYPILKKAHEIKPNDLETVKALLQIAIRLNLADDMKKYTDLKKQLSGG